MILYCILWFLFCKWCLPKHFCQLKLEAVWRSNLYWMELIILGIVYQGGICSIGVKISLSLSPALGPLPLTAHEINCLSGIWANLCLTSTINTATKPHSYPQTPSLRTSSLPHWRRLSFQTITKHPSLSNRFLPNSLSNNQGRAWVV